MLELEEAKITAVDTSLTIDQGDHVTSEEICTQALRNILFVTLVYK